MGRAVVLGGLAYSVSQIGCVQVAPPEAVEAVKSIDRDLVNLRAVEYSPDEYAHFVDRWIVLKARVDAEDDAIRWPWESNDVGDALRLLHEDGQATVARINMQRESLKRSALDQLARVEDRHNLTTLQIHAIDGRLILGRKPVETDLLIKQARSFLQQGLYGQSLEAARLASENLVSQAALLNRELGRYADRDHIGQWKEMARHTVHWSRTHRTTAIVVSKADRLLTLYRSGEKVATYSIRLGYNGIKEKRYQGDGATPEGLYRIADKRGQGQTQFFRALVLDYPNGEDRRRFQSSRKAGRVPSARSIGGQIEIHGGENRPMQQTLGCVMLDNPHMALLFNRVDKGTPVTIVGALHEENSIARALTNLDAPAGQI